MDRTTHKRELMNSVYQLLRFQQFLNRQTLEQMVRDSIELNRTTDFEREEELFQRIHENNNLIIEEALMFAIFNPNMPERYVYSLVHLLKR